MPICSSGTQCPPNSAASLRKHVIGPHANPPSTMQAGITTIFNIFGGADLMLGMQVRAIPFSELIFFFLYKILKPNFCNIARHTLFPVVDPALYNAALQG